MRKIATIAAAFTLATAQVAAAAPATTASTTAASQRAGTPVANASQLRGGASGGHVVVYLGALAAVILGIIAAARQGTPRPTSPG